MRIGTNSVLFGAHCFFLHPWFVAAAWWKLYGFPFDPRLWVAFFVHDIGYLGKPNMDGDEGEKHVELGAKIMRLFDQRKGLLPSTTHMLLNGEFILGRWGQFSLFHSRFYAKKFNKPYSRLCVADKLAICLTPAWMYLPMVNWTGEIREYMAMSKENGNTKYSFMSIDHKSQRQWHANMCSYLRRWVAEHQDLKADTWTPEARKAIDPTGVWQ